MIEKIISGGQTGVDRAALDVALELGIPCGGWCPQGRRAEDGPIPARYPLQETRSKQYPSRTKKNVLEADATLILTSGAADRGTALTIRLAAKYGKPHWVVDLSADLQSYDIQRALAEEKPAVLNVAGPRESSAQGIYNEARSFLRKLLHSLF